MTCMEEVLIGALLRGLIVVVASCLLVVLTMALSRIKWNRCCSIRKRGMPVQARVIPLAPVRSLETFLPSGATFYLTSPCGNHLHYVLECKLYKLTRLSEGMVQMTKIDLNHTVKKMEHYRSWDLIHTEDNKILFIKGDNIQAVNNNIQGVEVEFSDMYDGAFIGKNGTAYHLGSMEVDRFYQVLELASKMDINLTSLQEIKIDKSNGNMWMVTNSRGLQVAKMN